MAAKTKKFLTHFILDVICLLAVGLPILMLYLFGQPHIRGFFCHDSSIRHPYLPSTVPSSVMIPINYIVPILTFLLVETVNLKANSKAVLSSSYHHTKVFAFGGLSTTLLTDLTKYTVGRPRPHFIDVCNPDVVFNNETCGTHESPIYVTEYECRGNEKLFPDAEKRDDKLKDSRLSFWSGHASLTWFAMFYTAMFLQWRLMLGEQKNSVALVVAVLQVGCLIFALYTSVTRVADYKHHPGDVLAGSLLGVVWSVIVFTWVSGIDRSGRKCYNSPNETTSLVAKEGKPGGDHTV